MIHDVYTIKISKVPGTESFQAGKHIHVPGEWHTPTPQVEKPLCLGLLQTSLFVSLHLVAHLYPSSYPLLDNKLVNLSVSLSSASHSSKLIDAEEGVMETSDL